ncbi:MAG: ABC transporter permease [Xylophilus ampelinus]
MGLLTSLRRPAADGDLRADPRLPAGGRSAAAPSGAGGPAAALRPALSAAARRALQALLLALSVGLLCFFLLRLLPGDMAYRIAAERYGYDMVDTAAAEAVRAELGLDRHWATALGEWWGRLLRGDFGLSWASGRPVAAEVGHQLGHTLQLAGGALLLSLLAGLPLGLAAGLRPGGWIDRATLAAALALRALPPFVLGLGLVLALSVQLGALPAAGHEGHGSLLLPAVTLALGLAALSCRVTRDAMRAVAAAPYYAFARTKGLGARAALLRHGLRNVGVPVVAYLGVQLAFLVEGVVVVETLFAWPGIGHALVHAIFGRDVPMIQGTAMAMGLLFVGLNALVDLACLAIDPRRRRAA